MNIRRSKNTVALVKDEKGEIVGYLTDKHIEQGLDIQLDMVGYKIESI